MSDAVNTRRHIDLQQVLRSKFAAVEDRRDGIPAGTPWAEAIGVGRPCGFPLRLQGLAYERLPRPFRLGGHPERTLLRAAPCGNPWASQRGRLAIELERLREPPALRRGERSPPIAARGVLPTVVLGHPTHREQPGRPGRAQQVLELAYCADITTWRGSVPPLLEAADMALDLLPGDVWPGRHQGLTILWVGSWPLTHHGTVQDTGPTSADPGHYPWPWLFRASSAPTACGWPLLQELTTSQSAAGGDAVPGAHDWHPSSGVIHRVARQCRAVRTSGCRRRLLCHVGSSVSASCAGSPSRWLGTPSLALLVDAC